MKLNGICPSVCRFVLVRQLHRRRQTFVRPYGWCTVSFCRYNSTSADLWCLHHPRVYDIFNSSFAILMNLDILLFVVMAVHSFISRLIFMPSPIYIHTFIRTCTEQMIARCYLKR